MTVVSYQEKTQDEREEWNGNDREHDEKCRRDQQQDWMLDQKRCRELSRNQRSPIQTPSTRHTSTTATLVSNLLLRRHTSIALNPANTSGINAHQRKPLVPHQLGSASVPVRAGTISNDAMNAHQDVQMRRKGMATAVPCSRCVSRMREEVTEDLR